MQDNHDQFTKKYFSFSFIQPKYDNFKRRHNMQKRDLRRSSQRYTIEAYSIFKFVFIFKSRCILYLKKKKD